jgi:hypothetical protein
MKKCPNDRLPLDWLCDPPLHLPSFLLIAWLSLTLQ